MENNQDSSFSSPRPAIQKTTIPGLKAGTGSKTEIFKKLSSLRESKKKTELFESSNPEEIQAGMLVEHQRFGRGKVLQMEGTMPDIKATVFFQNAGKKQLLLKFAKLRIIT